MVLILSLLSIVLFLVWVRYFKNSHYAHFPGPKGIPIFGNLFQIHWMEIARDLESWSWKYGPVYRFNLIHRPFLVVSDIQTCHEILKARPDGFSRGTGLSSAAQELNIDGLFSQEGDEWRHSRYWIANAFSPTKVREFKKCVWFHSKKLQERLRSLSEEQARVLALQRCESADSSESKFPIRNSYDGNDLTESILNEIQSAVLSIVCDVSFSWGEENFLSHDILNRSKIFLSRMFERAFSMFPTWKFYKNERDVIAESTSAEFTHRIQALIDRGYKHQENRDSRTLLETLIKSTLEADGDSTDLSEKRRRMHRLTHAQMKANLLTVVMAGYETTATVMSWVLYELAKNPQYQDRIRAEVQQAFGDINQLDIEQDLTIIEKVLNSPDIHLPFVNAIIQESLRIHSVAPVFQFSALKDHDIQGLKISKGTEIFLLTRVATLRSWPTADPFRFNPEQWLGENGESESQIKTMNKLGLAFGFGPRVCPGRHLAETELIVLTSLIVASFQLSLISTPPAEEPVMEKQIFTMYPANLRIRIEPIILNK
ncbi:cytochrome P450 [Basidiobolus meristosporus CBS 931.73]|uniref:Cytochrome P450 n=1 Tax=Basidiobolus meristosporus CBS 931.73 TaxID=1314790 RepID=A0A1Y1YQM3_9FUNG|nr:cytochrome P450 [Basidiobolus meristosporus CBS 931.73]|eukprot:ORY00332.1 cytochrome P450 [Basidiobolus meristosporus CBS 931.73]